MARRLGAEILFANSENLLLIPRAGRLARCPVIVATHGIRFASGGRAIRQFFFLQQRWVAAYLASFARALRPPILSMAAWRSGPLSLAISLLAAFCRVWMS